MSFVESISTAVSSCTQMFPMSMRERGFLDTYFFRSWLSPLLSFALLAIKLCKHAPVLFDYTEKKRFAYICHRVAALMHTHIHIIDLWKKITQKFNYTIKVTSFISILFIIIFFKDQGKKTHTPTNAFFLSHGQERKCYMNRMNCLLPCTLFEPNENWVPGMEINN